MFHECSLAQKRRQSSRGVREPRSNYSRELQLRCPQSVGQSVSQPRVLAQKSIPFPSGISIEKRVRDWIDIDRIDGGSTPYFLYSGNPIIYYHDKGLDHMVVINADKPPTDKAESPSNAVLSMQLSGKLPVPTNTQNNYGTRRGVKI